MPVGKQGFSGNQKHPNPYRKGVRKVTRQADMLLLEETLRMFGVACWQGRVKRSDIEFVINRLWGLRDTVASDLDSLRRECRKPKDNVDTVVNHVIRVVEAGRVETNAAALPHRAHAA